MTQIHLRPLQISDFPLLQHWLETPHVRAWWDSDVNWTPQLIEEKYSDYVKGFKLQTGKQKKLDAFIICVADSSKPIGYVQIYGAHDFPRSAPLDDLPASLAAFDIFIGDINFIGRGFGVLAIESLLGSCVQGRFEYVFADPDVTNLGAVRCYEKAGFKHFRENLTAGEVWMLRRV
jgi:aminoglycoside 6'-N-acetyltransferase